MARRWSRTVLPQSRRRTDGRGNYSRSAVCATGAPGKLFDTWIRSYLANFDVSADGQRFLILAPGDDFVPTPMNIVINWQALLNMK